MIDRNALIEADKPFVASMAAVGAAEGYLGSTAFLDGLLRVMVSDWMEALGSGTATTDLAKRLVDEDAAILFGEVDGFGKLPGWNEPGGIDVYVAAELGTSDTGRDAIENALIQMLKQATAIANYADEPGVLDEQWRWQLDAMFEEYVNLFLGMPGEDPDGPEFGPPDEPSEPLTEGWVTINTGDDDEGGQRVYIDGSGTMQTGHFKGKTLDQAFGKEKSKTAKPADAPTPKSSPMPAKGAAKDPEVALSSDESKAVDLYAKHFINSRKVTYESRGILTGVKQPHDLGFDQEAKAILSAIDRSPKSTVDLHRSVSFEPGNDPFASATVGSDLDMRQITSFTSKPEMADEYASIRAGTHPEATVKYKVVLKPGAKALPTDSVTNMNHGEYLTHGQFKVVDVSEKDGTKVITVDPTKAPDPKPADSPAGDGKPKLAKPAAFGSMMGGPAKSVNTSLNEMPDSIDAGGVGLMFDIVGANEHDELAKAIKTVRPDMASAVDTEIADRKASAEKWAKAKAENDDLMSVHPSLAKPSQLNKTKVKAAFKDVAPDQHDKLIKAISAARPDLADHAAASKPKAKAAKASVTKFKEPKLRQPTLYTGDKAESEKAFKSLSKVSAGALVGAPDESDVVARKSDFIAKDSTGRDDSFEGVEIHTSGPGVDKMIRRIYRDDAGDLVMHNAELKVSKPGLGREILRNQIAAAQAAGVKRIVAKAMGEPGSKLYNGYYTWARYGYDASVDTMPPKARDKIKAAYPQAKMLSDVMATSEGRQWWKENGSMYDATFDLTPGSKSMTIFNAYLAAKGE